MTRRKDVQARRANPGQLDPQILSGQRCVPQQIRQTFAVLGQFLEILVDDQRQSLGRNRHRLVSLRNIHMAKHMDGQHRYSSETCFSSSIQLELRVISKMNQPDEQPTQLH